MSMKINDLLLLSSIVLLTSCRYDSNLAEPKKVSLIDYIDKSDLEKYGFSANDIENFDTKIKDNGVFANDYKSYEVNGFTILSSTENTEHIFILKNNKFIATFDDQSRSLYSTQTNIPTRLDAIVTYIPEIPSLSYSTNKLNHYDLNLDGIDIISEIIPSDDKGLDYFSAELLGAPNLNIVEASINGKECKALAGSFACCLSSQESYDAYKFSYQDGWISLPTNKKLNTICNAEDFETSKHELKNKLFELC